MKRFFQYLFHKLPLVTILVISSVIVGLIGVLGQGSVYRESGNDHRKTPFISDVMQGIHNGRYPWQMITGVPEDSSSRLSELAQSASTGETAGAFETTASSAASATTSADQENAADGSTSRITVQANSDGTYTMPDGVCSPVVPAVDYGTCDPVFLDPPGTVYNTDTNGIFAQNGTYYRLQSVSDSYFGDALFIGDSRTHGLQAYGTMEGLTDFLAQDSLTLETLFSEPVVFHAKDGSESQMLITDLLSSRQYRKIYLSLGINEIGYGTTTDYYQNFRNAVTIIRNLQPDAIIYIEGIMHVSYAIGSSSSSINNTNIVQKNEAIATLANGRDIFYIDLNSALCDSDGDLPSNLTGDGVHLEAEALEMWHQFLKQNAIVRTPEDNAVENSETASTGAQVSEDTMENTTEKTMEDTADNPETQNIDE